MSLAVVYYSQLHTQGSFLINAFNKTSLFRQVHAARFKARIASSRIGDNENKSDP